MARRAYRRSVTGQEVQTLLDLFESWRQDGGSFEEGVQIALEYMLVSPPFLLRVYDDPPGSAPGEAYRLSDLEVASRLSFFLWSSIPDESLLELTERGELTDPEILEQQVGRMLTDPRAIDALVTDFAGQWLNLRRVQEVVVDPLVYPNYDVNLLEGFQRETNCFWPVCCVRIVVCWTSFARTIPMSTNAWPGIMGFRGLTAAASGE